MVLSLYSTQQQVNKLQILINSTWSVKRKLRSLSFVKDESYGGNCFRYSKVVSLIIFLTQFSVVSHTPNIQSCPCISFLFKSRSYPILPIYSRVPESLSFSNSTLWKPLVLWTKYKTPLNPHTFCSSKCSLGRSVAVVVLNFVLLYFSLPPSFLDSYLFIQTSSSG